MCLLSQHLRLCTCNKVDLETAENYWVFHRRQAPSETARIVMGEMTLPLSQSPQTETLNEQTLLHILNSETPFDTDLKPKQHDRLSLYFTLPAGYFVYGFRYFRGKWVPEEWNPFEWQWKHREEKEGRIEGAF